jgi:integrase
VPAWAQRGRRDGGATVYEVGQSPHPLGTYCLRKTFANAVYEANHHDLPKTQKALGHRNINSTVAY